MITKNIKKFLSGILATAFVMIYTGSIGLCTSVVPQVTGEVQKPALRASAQPYSLRLEGDICISKKNPKITLSLRNSDVRQVLRMFADKAGLNIIFHESVPNAGSSTTAVSTQTRTMTSSGATGTTQTTAAIPASATVTLDLVNVPLNDAFRMVLQVSGLTYFIDNNTMVVTTADAARSLNLAKQELLTIPVKYVDAGALATFLNRNIFSINKPGLSNAQIAITNPGSNEILIFGTKNDYLMAKKVVAQLDVKPLEEAFVVNHTTPAEMANLVCNFLRSAGNGSSGAPASAAISPVSSHGITLGSGTVACEFGSSIAAGTLGSLTTNGLAITFFPGRGTIVAAGGSASQMEMIREFIAKNDTKQPQAYLELSVIELNESGSKIFNNTWNVYSGFFSGSFDPTGVNSNSTYPKIFGQDYYTVERGNSTHYDQYLSKITGAPSLTYTMKYLINNHKGRVLANPKIIITSGQTSKIDLKSDYVSNVDAAITTSITGDIITYTYNIKDDNGISITLTPYISQSGFVTLNITPKYSTIQGFINGIGITEGLRVVTLLQKRDLDLKNIRIKDGETLVLGGMTKEEETKEVTKIPILGDLPGVGMFFRNTDTEKEKTELIIMITPKIIKDTDDVVNNTDATL